MHHCDNPICVNPRHLWVGTRQQNSTDMVLKGRSRTGTKHWNVKLTENQVAAIRADPRTQKLIAADYGISQPLVSVIKTGQRWRSY